MSFFDYDVTFKQEDGFLRVTAAGTFSVRRSKRLWGRVALEAQRLRADKILVDKRGVRGWPKWEDQFVLGNYVGAHIRSECAVLVEGWDLRFGEWLARRAGVMGWVFTEEPAAIAWLLRDRFHA